VSSVLIEDERIVAIEPHGRAALNDFVPVLLVNLNLPCPAPLAS
jgi:hypothetical protein